MRPNKQTLKPQLLARFEQEFDTARARLDDDRPLNWDEIEEIARKARARIGEELTQALADTQTAAPVHNPLCSECQHSTRYKGRKSQVIGTTSGDIRLERRYYYCPHCCQGFFPLDVDGYHASQHLAQATATQYPTDAPRAIQR